VAEAEAVLLRRFTTTGDAEAFAELIRRHAGLVYGAAMRILADVDRAADVTQETFLQLTNDAPRVSGSLAGWLHRVATHKAIDQMRRDTSRRRREAEYAADQPREMADWRELSHCVDEELNRLDDQTREVLIAHFLEGRTTRQIAAAQGVSQATISRRVDAGVTRLRATLRRRGVLVAAGALSAMLSENAAQAVPRAVMMELGKVALLGAPAASAGASTIHAVTTGLLTGAKAKAVAVAAVAVIGIGSVVTYQHATRSRLPENTLVTRSPVSRASSHAASASSPISSAPVRRAPAAGAGSSAAVQRWDELMSMRRRQAGAPGSQKAVPRGPASAPVEEQTPVSDAYGLPMMSGAVTSSGSAPPQNGAGGMGGGMMFFGSSSTSPPRTPNDSNAPKLPER
jgi:RNA polymerase sigma factor (sigma-70 family)